MPSNRKCEIIERTFTDHGEAIIYCSEHACATYPRKCEGSEVWQVFEIVPVESK